MQIITASHVDVKEEILNPYSGIYCTIIQFDIYGLKTLWEFVIHNFISEA